MQGSSCPCWRQTGIISARGSRLALRRPRQCRFSPSGWLGSRRTFPPTANGDSACSPFRMAGCSEKSHCFRGRLRGEFHSLMPIASKWAIGCAPTRPVEDSSPKPRELYLHLRRTFRDSRARKSGAMSETVQVQRSHPDSASLSSQQLQRATTGRCRFGCQSSLRTQVDTFRECSRLVTTRVSGCICDWSRRTLAWLHKTSGKRGEAIER